MISFFLISSGANLCHSAWVPACSAQLGHPIPNSCLSNSVQAENQGQGSTELLSAAPKHWGCSLSSHSTDITASSFLPSLSLSSLLKHPDSPTLLLAQNSASVDQSPDAAQWSGIWAGPAVTHNNRTQRGILSTQESQHPSLRKDHFVYVPEEHPTVTKESRPCCTATPPKPQGNRISSWSCRKVFQNEFFSLR